MGRRVAVNLLLALVVVFLASGAWTASRSAGPAPVSRAGDAPPAEPLTVRFSPPDRAAFREIAVRPPFQESRRPYRPAAPETAAPAAAPPPAVKVTGVVLTGDASRALVQVGGGAPELVAMGARIGGWELTEISPDGIVLTRQGRTHRVGLGDAPAPGGAAPGAEDGAGRDRPAAPSPIRDMSEMIDQ